MIARSFRPVGWVAAVGGAALGCYMLSLQVAAERADLDRLDARIVAASQQIRSLQTELGTRGRMQQLEEWNEEVLALAAPVSGQFVEGRVSLARFDVRQPPAAPELRLASATPAPAPPAAAAATPVPAPQRAVAAPPAPAANPPLVRQASVAIPPPPAAPAAAVPKPSRAETAPARIRTAATDERERPAATAPARTRPAGLIDDRTMRDLNAASRAERGGGTRN